MNETKEIREIQVLGHGPTGLQRRRARKEAKALAAQARRALGRHGHRVPKEPRADLETAITATESATEAGDHDKIVESLVKLDSLVDAHLSFTKKSTFREYADSIGVAVLVALLLRAFVVEAFKIPSGSMIPTMEVGDHIFVNKFIYGLRIPFTKIKFFDWRKPRRGEVIVFIYPNDPSKDFIKRIVAVEGDTVEVRRSIVKVNGQVVEHHPMPGTYTYWDRDEQRGTWNENVGRRVDEVVDGKTYITLHDPEDHEMACRYACYEPYTVPPGHVFVLGDNRNNSHDSRFWGPVPLDNIKGKALVIWWSSGEPEGIRWNRLGRLVE